MPKLKLSLAMSFDGYVAGPSQTLEHPLGEGGTRLMEWAFATRTFHEMMGKEGGETGLDDDHAGAWKVNTGATIMGRNMFGPIRGEWGTEDWRGWWGETPPYGTPVFVLTNHGREPLEMEGGTTFHFVKGGIDEALERAWEAAEGKDVSIGGGCSTARQYLETGAVDEVRLHVVPVVLGRGERLLDGLDGAFEHYVCTALESSPRVCHYTYTRRDSW